MINLAVPVTLFISPHLDDAVFSCGGYAYRLALAGAKVVIVTVITADDSDERLPSWLAKRYTRQWNLDKNPFAARCQEDEAAARVLHVETMHLGFLDAIYRRGADGQPLYAQAVTHSPVHAYDWEVFEPAVKETLGNLKNQYNSQRVIMICPLGVGGHLDHQIVRHAVEGISEPKDTMYYEDFPYSIQANDLENASAAEAPRTRNLHPEMIKLSPGEADARQRAMACYTSQIPGCFPSKMDRLIEILRARLPFVGTRLKYSPNLSASLERMNSRMRAYIARVGGERYWLHANEQIPDIDGS
jgi:LmbE family N-acetylglucosaminyl deacetylase